MAANTEKTMDTQISSWERLCASALRASCPGMSAHDAKGLAADLAVAWPALDPHDAARFYATPIDESAGVAVLA